MSPARPTTLVAAAAGAAVALARWTPVFDPDCFWHLHTGRYIATHGAVPWVDVFSHTARGRPWRFIDVAADVTLYAAWLPAGPASLVAFTVALGAAAVALSVFTQARALDDAGEGAPPWPLVAVAPWVVAAVAFRLTPRPQTFTFVALAALVHLVVASRRNPRLLGWAVPLTAAWQALHPSGPLAVLVLGATAVGAVVDRARGAPSRPPGLAWAVTAASLPALLASPHPLDRLREGFLHATDPQLAAMITEWQPVWSLGGVSPAVASLGGLAALALAGALPERGRRADTALLLAAAGVTVLALRAVRFIPLAALALAPLAALGARRITAALGARAGAAAALALALGGAAALHAERKPFGAGVSASAFPVRAAEFVARTSPEGPLVHDFEWGGYLLWALDGRYPVFVDGRSWALYDKPLLLDALQLTADRLERRIATHGHRLAVLRTEARVGHLQDLGWRLAYLDDTASVLVRAPDDSPYVMRYGYRELRPARWYEDIARLARDPSALARARVEAGRMTREAPGSALAWVLRAAVHAAAGEGAAADEAAARAVALRPDLTAPRRMMMLRCDAAGDRACACREAAAVRARSPRNAQAREVAGRLGCP